MGRREKGTGSISQRKDGTWTARVVLGYKPDGKPKVKALYAKTEKEVKKKLREYLKTRPEWNPNEVGNETVTEFMLSWLFETKQNTIKPTTVDSIEASILNQISPKIGHIQIKSLQSSDIQKMVNQLRDEGLCYLTVKKAYNSLNDCLRTAVLQNRISSNPALGVTIPKQSESEEKKIKVYTEEELQRIFDVALSKYKNGNPVYRLGDAVVLAANTGLRVSELCGLRWEDVDMENRILSVRNISIIVRDRSDSEKRYIKTEQKTPKTKSSMRDVYLNDNAIESLQRLKEITGQYEHVLTDKSGELASKFCLDRMLKAILRKAGFPEDKIYGFHALRHSFASVLFAHGVDVKTVSELLGHSNVSITYNTYIHLIKNQKEDAVSRIRKYNYNINVGEN